MPSMKLIRAYKTELDPTCKQIKQLLQHAGCARWAYNWGLRKKIEAYKATGKSPSAIDLHRELNVLKKKSGDDGGVPWMYESSKCAPQGALRDLDAAYKGFFKRCEGGAKKKGFPRFKSRKNGIGSFRLTGAIHAFESSIYLPVLGELRLKERGYISTEGVKVFSATVSESAGRWFVSLQVEQVVSDPEDRSHHVVGVDVGIRYLSVTSDGEFFANPKALVRAQRKLRIHQKAVSRKVKGSKNRKKAATRVAVAYRRITNIRKDAIHKMTTSIAKNASVIVVEDLNVLGMLKNHCIAQALSDASLSEIHRQLSYKTKWYGSELHRADRFYPSSKRCSECGNIKNELPRSEYTYHCEICGVVIDRDLNAAFNLKMLAGSSPVSACRLESAGRAHKSPTKLSIGQEPIRLESVCGGLLPFRRTA